MRSERFNPRGRRAAYAVALTTFFLLFAGCRRPAPCEGNTCGGKGECRVVVAPSTEVSPPFERYQKERLVEVCDCNGKSGFEYNELGCGPAAEFKTCVPERCDTFVDRCTLEEVCFYLGPDHSPECRKCPDEQVPNENRQGCIHLACRGFNQACPDQETCQENGQCGPCPQNTVFDEETKRCRKCPVGFMAKAGHCKAQIQRAYVATKLQILEEDGINVFGALNENGFFREYWKTETDDGYNMIWDQDLLLVFVIPELDQVLDKDMPTEPIEAEVDVYNGLFVSTDIWREYRGEAEPKEYRDSRRSKALANYLAETLTGEECARAVGVDCNPGHFRGDDLLRAKHVTRFDCSPKLSKLRARISREHIETIEAKNWLVMPYEPSKLLMQAYQLKAVLDRKSTGLCARDNTSQEWPCTGYVGTLRFALRAIDLIDSFRASTGGGVSEDIFAALLGTPDIDQDDDGMADSYSIQVDIDLTPIQFVATTTTSTKTTVTSTSS